MIFKYKVPVQPPYQAKSWTPLWRKNFRILNIIIFLVWFFTSKKKVPEKWGILNSVTACLILGDMQPWMYWYIRALGGISFDMFTFFWNDVVISLVCWVGAFGRTDALKKHKLFWISRSMFKCRMPIFTTERKTGNCPPHLRSTSEDSVPSTMTRPFLPGLPARISPAGGEIGWYRGTKILG